ncbi:MAG: ABC transporter ATP-binding protein [Candidatus Hodarchaeales archaeon]
MSQEHLRIEGLFKKFGKNKVLRNIDISINKGECVVILGPTGAGKTTLLKIIAGLVKPTKGFIYKNGEIINKVPPEKRNMAYLPQTSDYSLFPYLNVWKNTIFSPEMKGEKEYDEIASLGKEVLDLVNLSQRYNAYPNELSGGMKQRVALARAIVADAEIFLLDEPLRALDARLRIKIRNEIRNLISDLGKTTLWVTHDQEEAIAVADRIMILNNGVIDQFGTPEELYLHPTSVFSAYFLGETNLFTGTFVKNEKDSELIECKLDSWSIFINKNEMKFSNPSKKLIVAFKAEKVHIKSNESKNNENGELNTLYGKVIGKHFLGKQINIVVKTSKLSQPIKVLVPSSQLETFEVGDMVFLYIPPEEILYFGQSEESLELL